MSDESRHLSTFIDRSAADVYAYASDPANLVHWAAGLGSATRRPDGSWMVQSPMGLVTVVFAPQNAFGVLDHEVILATGETVYNPMRVIADGPGSEVVFTLRRTPEMTDRDLARDADAVIADLAALKRVLEGT
jgi:hypothetical protein